MSFYEEFLHALFWQPIRALAALYWHLTRRRVRARNRLRQISSNSPYVYDVWVKTVEQLDAVMSTAPGVMAQWSHRPLFSIILYVDPAMDARALQAAIQSVELQCYQDWELLLVPGANGCMPTIQALGSRVRCLSAPVANDVAGLNMGVANARGDFLLPFPSGGSLSPVALFRFAEALNANPNAAILFGDHDQISLKGRRSRPWFKPQWNSEMFLAQDFISSACVIRAESARIAGRLPEELEGAASYALLLEVAGAQGTEIIHVPHILSHVPDVLRSGNQAARLKTVVRHLRGAGRTASEGEFGLLKVGWSQPAQLPMVSIIIPTRDKVALLRRCIESLLSKTNYEKFEVIIVDNGSIRKSTKSYLSELVKDSRFRVLRYEGDFNYSAMNNIAVRNSRGQVLCLLNNDTEVVTPDWLNELTGYAIQESIGAVGAKLLYPDGSIQHAGVVIGLGNAAGHAHRHLKAGKPGYFLQAHVTHFASAVTAACLVVEKKKFVAVGGLDAENLKVAFNDVDFCLKLQQAGWDNVYVSQAVLVHHESKSRGKDMSRQNVDRYMRELEVLQRRWNTTAYVDPLHHPNLDRTSENYAFCL